MVSPCLTVLLLPISLLLLQQAVRRRGGRPGVCEGKQIGLLHLTVVEVSLCVCLSILADDNLLPHFALFASIAIATLATRV